MATGCVVARSRIILVSDISRVFTSTCPVFPSNHHEGRDWIRKHQRWCRHMSTNLSSNSKKGENTTENEVKLEWRRGVPHLLIPLPTSQQPCLFTLRPARTTVGDFVQMIKQEDQAVGDVVVRTADNIRVASSNSISNLIDGDFKLTINNKEYYVKSPSKSERSEGERLEELRALVSQLYTSLHADETSGRMEEEMQSKLEDIKHQLEPLEKKKQELDVAASRKANALTWVGLGLMSVQFGILARLTWWEYSWDIMEPVTYFVTYGTAMAAYAYFVLTRQEYLLPDVRDRQHLLDVHKRASKIGLDLSKYNRLKDEMCRLESDLSRLKDPIRVMMPPPSTRILHSQPSPLSATASSSSTSLFHKARIGFQSLTRLLRKY